MPTVLDLETYRRQARAWLEANLEKRDRGQPSRIRGVKHRAREDFLPERALQRKLYEAGYAGIRWPKEYGGQGLGPDFARAFGEEAVNYRLPDLGVAGGTTFGPCGETIIRHASPEFLVRHIPKMLAGEELFVQFFSEPGAGSDLAGVTTRAVKDGDRWVITGSKIWTSGAYYADYGMCLARTDSEAPKHRGLTWFAVPILSKGVTVQPIREINGDAEFCQEFLDEVEVTDDEVIGEVNHGWAVAQTMLVFERSGGSGRSTPSARGGRRDRRTSLAGGTGVGAAEGSCSPPDPCSGPCRRLGKGSAWTSSHRSLPDQPEPTERAGRIWQAGRRYI